MILFAGLTILFNITEPTEHVPKKLLDFFDQNMLQPKTNAGL